MFKAYLYVVAVFVSISIFNMINFKRAMDKRYGRGHLNFRKIQTILKFGFCRTFKFWLLDWYFSMRNPDFIYEMITK